MSFRRAFESFLKRAKEGPAPVQVSDVIASRGGNVQAPALGASGQPGPSPLNAGVDRRTDTRIKVPVGNGLRGLINRVANAQVDRQNDIAQRLGGPRQQIDFDQIKQKFRSKV